MMHEFLANNREELTRRCREKVGARVGRSASEQQLWDGIPLFLDQLIRTLRIEQTDEAHGSEHISGPAGGGAAFSEVSVSAAQHGKDLLGLGLTVDQVVHDYGDLCQAITDLAVERDVPFHVNEFRTLNRCLDNAISDAVTEFSYQRDALVLEASESSSKLRMGVFANDLRNLLGTASLAFSAAKAGNLSLTGATGTILERSLAGLEKLISTSLEEVQNRGVAGMSLGVFSLSDFIAEIFAAASVTARTQGCTLRAGQVDDKLALEGGRDLLISAVANLLQNAFKFTQPGTEVLLSAYAAGDRILIDVSDQCGGLVQEVEEAMRRSPPRADADKAGLGLGLTIARQSVAAFGGDLTVANTSGKGCVFTINLPRKKVLD